YFYIETAQPFGKSLPHIPIAKDPYSFSRELLASVLLPVPDLMAHLPVGAGDMVEQCEQHAYSVLGYRIPIAFGCVVNGDVTRCQIVHINLIQTRSCPYYKSELSSFFQQGTVHCSLGSNNQSVILINNRFNFRAGNIRPLVHFKALMFLEGNDARMHLINNSNVH